MLFDRVFIELFSGKNRLPYDFFTNISGDSNISTKDSKDFINEQFLQYKKAK